MSQSKEKHRKDPEEKQDLDLEGDLLSDTEEVTPEAEPSSEEELRELNDRYLRVCADFDNFRRRSRQDRAASYDEAVMDTIRTLLPVVDSLDGALKAADACQSEETREFTQGLALIAQQLNQAFDKLGVTEIEGEGAEFDPNVHQAVIHGEDQDLPENRVVEVYQKGYRKGDRVIRHSMVRVVN